MSIPTQERALALENQLRRLYEGWKEAQRESARLSYWWRDRLSDEFDRAGKLLAEEVKS